MILTSRFHGLYRLTLNTSLHVILDMTTKIYKINTVLMYSKYHLKLKNYHNLFLSCIIGYSKKLEYQITHFKIFVCHAFYNYNRRNGHALKTLDTTIEGMVMP